jgi:hypothetical protein
LAWGCGLDSTGSKHGPVAGCCECGDEPSGSCATELVRFNLRTISMYLYIIVRDPVSHLYSRSQWPRGLRHRL